MSGFQVKREIWKEMATKGVLPQMKDLLKGQDSILQLSPSAQAFPGVPMLQARSTQGGRGHTQRHWGSWLGAAKPFCHPP